MKIRDLRGTYFPSHTLDTTAGGDFKTSDRCVGLFLDDPEAPTKTETRQTACYNEDLQFVCMSTGRRRRPGVTWHHTFVYVYRGSGAERCSWAKRKPVISP